MSFRKNVTHKDFDKMKEFSKKSFQDFDKGKGFRKISTISKKLVFIENFNTKVSKFVILSVQMISTKVSKISKNDFRISKNKDFDKLKQFSKLGSFRKSESQNFLNYTV